MALWTAEQVLALAPDASSAKAGQGLGSARKWQLLGQSERAAWGLMQGSGKDPYRVEVDFNGPAFKCSCPSRKFPCKHGLGLLLVLAQTPAAVPTGEPPDWVAEWLAKRADSEQKKVEKATKAAEPVDEETAARQAADKAKRAARREDRMRAGIDELGTFLRDVVRQGLAQARQQGGGPWQSAAQRLIDAQAPGAARLLQGVGDGAVTGDGWQDRMLRGLGALHALAEAAGRLETLPEDVQSEVRQTLGLPVKEEEVLATGPRLADTWFVLAQRTTEEERLRVQRTWLLGRETGRWALVLDFAFGAGVLDRSFVPGCLHCRTLAFFPGILGRRALAVPDEPGSPETFGDFPGDPSIAAALDRIRGPMAAVPWENRWPLCLADASLEWDALAGWSVTDAEDRQLPVRRSVPEAELWTLLALSRGEPLSIFGEWDGEHFLPMAVAKAGRYHALTFDPAAAL